MVKFSLFTFKGCLLAWVCDPSTTREQECSAAFLQVQLACYGKWNLSRHAALSSLGRHASNEAYLLDVGPINTRYMATSGLLKTFLLTPLLESEAHLTQTSLP